MDIHWHGTDKAIPISTHKLGLDPEVGTKIIFPQLSLFGTLVMFFLFFSEIRVDLSYCLKSFSLKAKSSPLATIYIFFRENRIVCQKGDLHEIISLFFLKNDNNKMMSATMQQCKFCKAL